MYEFTQIQNEKILLAFLNWGKGHLSRCIDVCRRLSSQSNTIFVACSAKDFHILSEYLPSLTHISFQDYPFKFSGKGDFTSDLLKSKKELSNFIKWEHTEVEKLVLENEISLVISDHRYGFYSKIISSIFITHQVHLSLKWWQFPAQLMHRRWINQFNHIWIMDDEQHSLAGKLSQKGNLKNASYIGHFSRFEERKKSENTLKIGVCSGPYPYNEQLLSQLVQNQELDYIISSIPSEDKRVIKSTSWKEADSLFYHAKEIHSYCGYSTLMDLKRLNCKGKLIPTPGQTEQEYLFKIHFK